MGKGEHRGHPLLAMLECCCLCLVCNACAERAEQKRLRRQTRVARVVANSRRQAPRVVIVQPGYQQPYASQVIYHQPQPRHAATAAATTTGYYIPPAGLVPHPQQPVASTDYRPSYYQQHPGPQVPRRLPPPQPAYNPYAPLQEQQQHLHQQEQQQGRSGTYGAVQYQHLSPRQQEREEQGVVVEAIPVIPTAGESGGYYPPPAAAPPAPVSMKR